jgi:hypothetical protein
VVVVVVVVVEKRNHNENKRIKAICIFGQKQRDLSLLIMYFFQERRTGRARTARRFSFPDVVARRPQQPPQHPSSAFVF